MPHRAHLFSLRIAQTYGLGGLLLATLMSGVLLIIMAVMRLGRFIDHIPESVTLGFTGGIAVVIVTLQIRDFFGLPVGDMPEHYWGKLVVLAGALPELDEMSALVRSHDEFLSPKVSR